MTSPPLRLGVNVDHVATVRNARGGPRPDPVRAALLAIDAGADGITAHLREDRRHINDADMARLKAAISKPLNFEMAATEQMLDIAVATSPHAVCLVPEKRTERTTEGGLDRRPARLPDALRRSVDARRRARLAVHRAVAGGARRRSLDQGAGGRAPYRRLVSRARGRRYGPGRTRIRPNRGSRRLRCRPRPRIHAGHGLDTETARRVSTLPQIVELNIGHFLIGEAIFVGLAEAIARMRRAMEEGRAQAL